MVGVTLVSEHVRRPTYTIQSIRQIVMSSALSIQSAVSPFAVAGAVNTLSVSEERYFKPSPSAFQRVRGRGKDAWLIRPGSYFLLPYRQAFARDFPEDFAILLTLRPTEESEVSE